MDNYEIVKELGKGTCGSVYLIQHKVAKRLLAVKKVQLDEKRKTRTKDAVYKEARILSELKHPHIVAYHDSFFDNDELYLHIIQDYCDGGSLDEKIKEKALNKDNFSEKQVMEWFIQIAMAVQYIHSKKILHRDIKAQNIFITKADGVKLGDFGIAKALENTMDAAVTCVGTPCYLSPELCQDIPYSSKSDVWALGCLLHEMCSLRPAFDAHNLVSLFYKIVKAEYKELPVIYSDSLKDLVRTILQKSPEERPSASSILNMPLVKDYLDEFIQEKEYLLQQKIISVKEKASSIRDSIVAKSLALSSPPSLPSYSANEESDGTTAAVRSSNSSRSQPSPSSVENKNNSAIAYGEASVYADDFEEHSDEESSADNDIQEDISVESDIENCSLEVAPSGADEIYADDFEDDSETEALDKIVSNAKEAQGITAKYEYFEDPEHKPLYKQSLRRHCIESIGLTNYEQIKLYKENRSHGDADEDSANISQEFRHIVGNDHTETCYLLNELD